MKDGYSDKVYKALEAYYKSKDAMDKLPSMDDFNNNISTKGEAYLIKIHGALDGYYSEMDAKDKLPDIDTFVSRFDIKKKDEADSGVSSQGEQNDLRSLNEDRRESKQELKVPQFGFQPEREERVGIDRNIPQPEVKMHPMDVQQEMIDNLTKFNKTLTAGQYQYYMNAHPWVRKSLEHPAFAEGGTTWITKTAKTFDGKEINTAIVIPLIYEGNQLTQEEAVGLYKEKTQEGLNWGIQFAGEEQAANFSRALANKSAEMQRTKAFEETKSADTPEAMGAMLKSEYDARVYSGMAISLSKEEIEDIMSRDEAPTDYSYLLGGREPIEQADAGDMYTEGGEAFIRRSGTKTQFADDKQRERYEAIKDKYGAKATAVKRDYEVEEVDINNVYFTTTEFGDKIFLDTRDGMEVYPENGVFNKYTYEGDLGDLYGGKAVDGSLVSKISNAMIEGDLYNMKVRTLDGGEIEVGALQSARRAASMQDPSGFHKFMSSALPMIAELPYFHVLGGATGGVAKGVSKLMAGAGGILTGRGYGVGVKMFELGMSKGRVGLLVANQGGMTLGTHSALIDITRQVADEDREISEIALDETLSAFGSEYVVGAFAGGTAHVSNQWINSAVNKISNPAVREVALKAGQVGSTIMEGASFYSASSLIHGEPMTLEGLAETIATFGVLKVTGAPVGGGRGKLESYKGYVNKMKGEGINIAISPLEKSILSEQGVKQFKDPKKLTQGELESITSNPDIPLTAQVKILVGRGIATNPYALKRSTTMKAGIVNKDGKILVETRLENGQLVEIKEFNSQKEAASHMYEVGHRVRVNQVEDMLIKLEKNGDAVLEVEAALGDKKGEYEKALKEINNTEFVKNVSPESIAKIRELHKILKETTERYTESYTKEGKSVDSKVIDATIENAKKSEDLANIEIKNDRSRERMLELKLDEFKTEQKTEASKEVKKESKATQEQKVDSKETMQEQKVEETPARKEAEVKIEAPKEEVVSETKPEVKLEQDVKSEAKDITGESLTATEKLVDNKKRRLDEVVDKKFNEEVEAEIVKMEKELDAIDKKPARVEHKGKTYRVKRGGKKDDGFIVSSISDRTASGRPKDVTNKKIRESVIDKFNKETVELKKEAENVLNKKAEEILNRLEKERDAEIEAFKKERSETYDDAAFTKKETEQLNLPENIEAHHSEFIGDVRKTKDVNSSIKKIQSEKWFKELSNDAKTFVNRRLMDLGQAELYEGGAMKRKNKPADAPARVRNIKMSIADRVRVELRAAKDAVKAMNEGLKKLTGNSKSLKNGLDDIRATLEKGKKENSLLTPNEYDRLITRIGDTNVDNANSVTKTRRYVKNAVRKANQRRLLSEAKGIMKNARKAFTIKKKSGRPDATQQEYESKESGLKIAEANKFDIEKISEQKEGKLNEIYDAVSEKQNIDKLVGEYAALEVAEAQSNYINAKKQADIFTTARDVSKGKSLSKAKQEIYKNNKEEINTLANDMRVSDIAETLYDGVKVRDLMGKEGFKKAVKDKLSKEDYAIFKKNEKVIMELMELIERNGILQTPGAHALETALKDAKASEGTMNAINKEWMAEKEQFFEKKRKVQDENKKTTVDVMHGGRSEAINEITTNAMKPLVGKPGEIIVSRAELNEARAELERNFRNSDMFLELSKKEQKAAIKRIQDINGKTTAEVKSSMEKAVKKYSRKKEVKFKSRNLSGGIGNLNSYVSALGHFNTRLREKVVNIIEKPYQKAYRNMEKVQALLIDLNKESNSIVNYVNGSTKKSDYGVTIINKDGKVFNGYNEMSPFQIAAIYNKFKSESHTASIEAKHGLLGSEQLRNHVDYMVERYPFIEKLARIEMNAGEAFFQYENRALIEEYGVGLVREDNYTTRNVESSGRESNVSQGGFSRYALPKNALLRMKVNPKIDLVNESSYNNIQKIGKNTSDAQFLSAQNNFYNILTDKQFKETITSSESGKKLYRTLKNYYENMPNIKARDSNKAVTSVEKIYLNIMMSNLALPNFVVPFGQTTSAINFSQSYTGSSIPIYKHVEAITGAVRNLSRKDSNFKNFHQDFWNHPAIKMRMHKSGTLDPSLSRFTESKLFHYSDKVDSWVVNVKEASMVGIKYGDITAWIGAYPTWSKIVNDGIKAGLTPEAARAKAMDYIVEHGLTSQQSNYAINQSPFQMWGKLGAAVPYFTTPLQHQQRIIDGLHKLAGTESTARERSQGVGQILHYAITAPALYYGSRHLMSIAKLSDEQWEEQNQAIEDLWGDMDSKDMGMAVLAFAAYGMLQGVPFVSDMTKGAAERAILGKDYPVSFGSMGMVSETAKMYMDVYKKITDPSFDLDAMSEIERSALFEDVAALLKPTGFNTTALMNILQKIQFGTTYPKEQKTRGSSISTKSGISTKSKIN